MAEDLFYNGRPVLFGKPLKAALFTERAVLAEDNFQFVDIWLKARDAEDALLFWKQARHFYRATRGLDTTAAPLTAYYTMLNATTALLSSKGCPFAEAHGVSGKALASQRSIETEEIAIKTHGVLSALSGYLGERAERTHTLSDILGNLPFVHRAFSLQRASADELFISLARPRYVRHPDRDKVWWCADVLGQDADTEILRSLPPGYEVDRGAENMVVRRRDRSVWFARAGASETDRAAALARLQAYHHKIRRDVVLISAATDLWYLKRRIANITTVNQYEPTLIMAAMHRLSELARYDPRGLATYLDGPSSWLLTEFIELATDQFLRVIACEITGLEFRMPGVRR